MRKGIHRLSLPGGKIPIAHKFLFISITALFLWGSAAFALEPNEILIIANKDLPESLAIAQYYCEKRAVPKTNILALPLGQSPGDTIARDNYDKNLAGPVLNKLFSSEFAGRIRCLLTIYGVPIKVTGRGPLKGQEYKRQRLENLFEQEKAKVKPLEQSGSSGSAKQIEEINRKIATLQSEISLIRGEETNASVDSELSMAMFGDYELYRWQPNKLAYKMPYWDFKSLMVCRLDGSGFKITKGLIDKAVMAEKTGLNGIVYIDSRGIVDDKKPYSFGFFDQSLRDLAEMIRIRTKMPVVEEKTEALFAPGQCPSAALYCGWYSVEKYVDAFSFIDGAIGYHISSVEAVDLRDPNSTQWCPAILRHGVTATLGAVAEPYLHSFPQPKEFFSELLDGYCLVEAYYRTAPFNSWQLILIGDPLYRPFKKP
jgi:uncharacterized protein (TIGR03790 family)